MLFHVRKQLSIAAALLMPFAFAIPFVNDSVIHKPPHNVSYPSSYKVAAYYVDWATYGRQYQPQDLPASQISHVLYAFANLQADGTVVLGDTYADLEKHFEGDSWQETGNNVHGCIKQLYLAKKQNRHMKTLLSIGGWSYSTNFQQAASTNTTRNTFANTAVTFVKDLGFDGIDIDWEYPRDETDAENFVYLLETTRTALDAYAKIGAPGYHFLLTAASPAGPTNYNNMHLRDMDNYLDSWHLMAYDYAGSWGNVTGHDANIYASIDSPDSTPFSTDVAVQAYIAAGVTSSKIVLGIPIYGRSFEQTTGMGESYTGIGTGTWEAGVYDYKDLPLQGSIVKYDPLLGASYSYNPTSKELVSYDTVEVVQQKVKYIEKNGLGGAMFWESSADGKENSSLIATASNCLGHLERSNNWLSYPQSQYANMAGGMSNATNNTANNY